MISQTAEYALRAAVFLSMNSSRSFTTERIAAATRVPAGYLSKVLQALSRAGLVRSRRGLKGGFAIARPAAQLSVLEIVNAVDPIRRIDSCPLELAAHGVNLCPLHHRLDEAIAMVERAFAGTSLAELIAEPSASIPLCAFPAASQPD